MTSAETRTALGFAREVLDTEARLLSAGRHDPVALSDAAAAERLTGASFAEPLLTVEAFLEGGIRCIELGGVAFATKDQDGVWQYPDLELVRMAIPRRVYTQAHIDYVVDTLVDLRERKERICGYRMTYEPPFLRHFTAEFEPLNT